MFGCGCVSIKLAFGRLGTIGADAALTPALYLHPCYVFPPPGTPSTCPSHHHLCWVFTFLVLAYLSLPPGIFPHASSRPCAPPRETPMRPAHTHQRLTTLCYSCPFTYLYLSLDGKCQGQGQVCLAYFIPSTCT